MVSNMKDEIRLLDLIKLGLQSIWRNRLMVGVISGLFMIIGILWASMQPVTNGYYASATIYSAIYGSYQESVTVSNAIDEYSGVLNSMKVCQRAEALIGDSSIKAEDIQQMISSRLNNTSTIMTVGAYSNNPAVSMKVANAVAEAFVIEIQGITGSDAIQILDEAQKVVVAENGYARFVKKVIAMTLIGFVIGCLCFVCLEVFSTRLKTIEQCSGSMGDELLGVIPMIKEGKRNRK